MGVGIGDHMAYDLSCGNYVFDEADDAAGTVYHPSLLHRLGCASSVGRFGWLEESVHGGRPCPPDLLRCAVVVVHNLVPGLKRGQGADGCYEVVSGRGTQGRQFVGKALSWEEIDLPGKNTVAVSHDIRTYYEEAAMELVTGSTPAGRAAEAWFFEETEAGRTIMAARTALKDQEAPFPFWFYMAPAHR